MSMEDGESNEGGGRESNEEAENCGAEMKVHEPPPVWEGNVGRPRRRRSARLCHAYACGEPACRRWKGRGGDEDVGTGEGKVNYDQARPRDDDGDPAGTRAVTTGTRGDHDSFGHWQAGEAKSPGRCSDSNYEDERCRSGEWVEDRTAWAWNCCAGHERSGGTGRCERDQGTRSMDHRWTGDRVRWEGAAEGPSGNGVEWQLKGLGEPPTRAGLPSTQTQSVSDFQPPRKRRRGSGPPLGACMQIDRPCEPAQPGRVLQGSDSVQRPRGGDVDAEDVDAAPSGGSDDGEPCDDEPGETDNDEDSRSALDRAGDRPGEEGRGKRGDGYEGRQREQYRRGDHNRDTERASCRRRGDRRSGVRRKTRRTGGNSVGDCRGKTGQAPADQEGRGDHRREDGGGTTTGRAKADATRADTKASIFGHLRVGEAKNPGPEGRDTEETAGRAEGGTKGAIPWSSERPSDRLQYPEPHRPGFRDVLTPGYEEEKGEHESSEAGKDAFALVVETVNATGWGPLKKRLRKTKAHIALAQETKVSAAAMATASTWSLKNGWKMIGAPATTGKNGGTSGGVAVFVRSYLGAHFPTNGNHVIEEGRAVAAVVDIDGCRPILAVSAYLRDGVGLNDANMKTIGKIGACVSAHGNKWQTIIGGDFNVEPNVLNASGFAQQMEATIVAPASRRGTCRTSTTAKVYDYFVVGNRMAEGIDEVREVEGSNVKTHTPVTVGFMPRLTALKKLVIQRPEPLEKERVFGPRLEPPDWEPTMKVIEEAVEAARSKPRDEAQDKLDGAYEAFARTAEEELAHATGTVLKKPDGRGRGPQFKWKSVLPERRPQQGVPTTATIAWMEGIAREVRRLISAEPKKRETEGGAEGNRRGRRGGKARQRGTGGERTNSHSGETVASSGVDEQHVDEDEDEEEEHEVDGIIDELGMALVADFPSEVHDATVLRLHNEAMEATDRASRARDADDETRNNLVQHLTDLIQRLKEQWNKHERHEDKEAVNKWKTWVAEDINKGAKRAHEYSRLPNEWMPTSTIEEGTGIVRSSPSALLEAQRAKYEARWEPTAEPRRIEWETREALPRLTAEEIGAASEAFPWSTALTHDGIHPRHASLLCRDGRSAMGALCEAIELLGALPSQLRLVTMPLLEKPSGGFRAIGMMAMLYRVWAKARRPYADKWEDAHRRPFWSADKSNGPGDTIWRQEARQEARVADGGQAATLIYDMEAFYETIDREVLLERARATGFPEPLIRVCLAAYGGPRMLSKDGALAREMYPTKGIIAGCGMATTMVKIYCLDPFDKVQKAIPDTVHFDAHIDDLVLTCEAEPRRVLADLTRAEKELQHAIGIGLKARVAEGKAGLVATSKELAQALRRQIPAVTGPVVRSMVNLGTDCLAGKKRGKLSNNMKRCSRLKKGIRRAHRLKILSKVIDSKARRIFVAGIAPAASYGASSRGLDDTEVRKLRRIAAAAFRPHTRNRSLITTLLIHDDPTATIEMAPAIQYARMTWKAKTQPGQATMRGAGLTHIRGWYDSARGKFAPLAEQILQRTSPSLAAGTTTKTAMNNSPNKAWRETRGPLGAAALTLARIGWGWKDAFTWTDDRGIDITVTAYAPAAMTDLLKDGHRRALEREAGKKRAEREEADRGGRRVCADLAERFLAGKCPKT